MPLFNDIEGFKNVDPALQWAIFIVGCLIIIVALVITMGDFYRWMLNHHCCSSFCCC